MIRFDTEPWKMIISCAEAAYPKECCGALLGTQDGDVKRVKAALPMDNVSSEERTRRYELRPEDLLRAQREAREQGFALLGIFHSHPDCDAHFSSTDQKNACPWYSYVVLSIRAGKFDHARCWLPRADQTSVREEDLEW